MKRLLMQKKRHEEATKRFFEELRLGADEQQAKWAERINKVKNGNCGTYTGTDYNCRT